MKSYRLQPVYLLIAAILAGVAHFAAASQKDNNTPSDADKRKADYIFMEALRYKDHDNAAYYELVSRAHQLNPSDPYLAREQGMKELLEGGGTDSASIERAFGLMTDYVRQNPEDTYTTLMYADVAMRADHPAEALEALRNTYNANPSRPEVGMAFARFLIANGPEHYDEALSVYDSIMTRDGISPEYVMAKIGVYAQRADTARVLDEALNLLSVNPRSPDYNAIVAGVYMQSGKPDSALYYYNKAVEYNPDSGVAYYNRAKYFSTIGDSVAYDREVMQAIGQPDLDLMSKLGILNDYVAKLYSDSTQVRNITRLCDKLIEEYPHEPEPRLLYSQYLFATRDFAKGAEQLHYALDSDPSDYDSWNRLASAYLMDKNYSKADGAIKNAIHYFPDSIPLYMLGSYAMMEQDRLKDALSYVDEAQSHLTDSTDYKARANVLSSKADVLYKMGQVDSSFALSEEALRLDPENALLLNNTAYYLACQDRDLDKAEEYIVKSLEINPESVNSLDTYAWVLFKKNNYEKAKEVIDGALTDAAAEEDPEISAELLEHAGDIYFMNRLPDRALEFWEKALELDPDNELLKRKVTNKTFFYE